MAEPSPTGSNLDSAGPAFEAAARVAARALSAPFAAIALLDGEQGIRVWTAGCAVDPLELGSDGSFIGRLLPSGSGPGRSITLTVSSRQPEASPHHLSRPLDTREGNRVGLLWVGSDDPRAWTADEAALLQDIAALVLSGIELCREPATRQALEDRLERAERVKNQFASALRHEFGQPLTVIQGFSELLSEGNLSPEEIREYALEIHKEAAHLTEIVAQIRDMDGKPWPKFSR